MDKIRVSSREEVSEAYHEDFPILKGVSLRLTELGRDSVDVALFIKDKQLNMADLVPGTTFKIADRIEVNTRTKEVFIRYDTFQNPRNIFALFHELGHVSVRDSQVTTGEGLQKVSRLREAKERDIDTASEHDLQAILDDERSAWAAGIRLARKVNQQNPEIDLFELFANPEEFSGWLRLIGLTSYECDLAEKSSKSKIEVITRQQALTKWLTRSVEDLFAEEGAEASALLKRTREELI